MTEDGFNYDRGQPAACTQHVHHLQLFYVAHLKMCSSSSPLGPWVLMIRQVLSKWIYLIAAGQT